MAGETLLTLSGQGMPPYAVRGITQSIEPIAAAFAPRRTVNGVLKNTAPTQFRKYRSTITCSDQQSPAFDAVHPGMTLTVGCVSELSYLTSGGSPSRTPVTNSSRTEGSFTFYRPSLVMMVIGKSQETHEYDAEISWTIELEEI